MRLDQLRQIIEIDKHHSISKAAKALYTSQPTLSGSLNSLESEIGVRLFERTPSGVVPTTEGREILQIAKQVLDGCDEILSYGSQGHQLSGDIDLFIIPPYGFLFPIIMVEFKRRFPKAHLNLQLLNSEKIVSVLTESKGNIGLIMWGGLSEHKLDDLKKRDLQAELFQDHLTRLYVSKEHHLANRESVTIKEIRHERIIAYSSDHWETINRKIHAELEPLIMTDREALMRMVYDGEGIAVLPETFSLNNLYCDQGLIKDIPIQGNDKFNMATECLIYPSKKRLTLLESKTVELLRDVLNRTCQNCL